MLSLILSLNFNFNIQNNKRIHNFKIILCNKSLNFIPHLLQVLKISLSSRFVTLPFSLPLLTPFAPYPPSPSVPPRNFSFSLHVQFNTAAVRTVFRPSTADRSSIHFGVLNPFCVNVRKLLSHPFLLTHFASFPVLVLFVSPPPTGSIHSTPPRPICPLCLLFLSHGLAISPPASYLPPYPSVIVPQSPRPEGPWIRSRMEIKCAVGRYADWFVFSDLRGSVLNCGIYVLS